MVNTVEDVASKKSLLWRFRQILISLYLLTLFIMLPVIGVWTNKEVHATANKELGLMVDMVKSLRTFIAEDVRPPLLEKQIFHPPAVSSTVATKKVSGHFLKVQPDYYIKVASDNPLNPDNLPQPLEEEILETFRKDRDLKDLIREGKIEGNNYLVSSRPSVSKDSCLKCHGTASTAPKEITDLYKAGTGYGYTSGQVVGVSVVGVPLQDVKSLVFQRSLVAFVVLTGLFSGIFILMDQLIQRFIIKPVTHISRLAREVSGGVLEQEIKSSRTDEIGELAKAVELMRRSLVSATNRLRKKKD
ncbi:DUF3365 domain-containing protein [Acaryochloris sp. CCMEE 5410]|uniref:c-type heme family protein n=1 Tax=Acaryochloris sp. CCMEE 5410 TaxID=310037 RepID=UPI001111CC2C|nr:DUF3365 domain-containing protein [Acaryochloris sp. CCMEE 5410]KAI9132029.1 DUF3365 domain-containing protein [Acaryochloris sp. CCMEE 5410]